MKLEELRKKVAGWRGEQLLPMWGRQKRRPPLKTMAEVPLVEQASRAPVLELPPKNHGAKWLCYIFLIVAIILIFGLSIRQQAE